MYEIKKIEEFLPEYLNQYKIETKIVEMINKINELTDTINTMNRHRLQICKHYNGIFKDRCKLGIWKPKPTSGCTGVTAPTCDRFKGD